MGQRWDESRYLLRGLFYWSDNYSHGGFSQRVAIAIALWNAEGDDTETDHFTFA